MDIFFLQKRMDSLQEAFIQPPEPCEAHFIMDARTLFDVFWTVEQKHPTTAMITLGIARTILHLHLVIWQTLLSKATYNWGIHKAIHLEEAIRQRKCS